MAEGASPSRLPQTRLAVWDQLDPPRLTLQLSVIAIEQGSSIGVISNVSRKSRDQLSDERGVEEGKQIESALHLVGVISPSLLTMRLDSKKRQAAKMSTCCLSTAKRFEVPE
jgi:hypothetical protein